MPGKPRVFISLPAQATANAIENNCDFTQRKPPEQGCILIGFDP